MIAENFYHQPVLKEEVCDLLITDKSGCYFDCTLGGVGISGLWPKNCLSMQCLLE